MAFGISAGTAYIDIKPQFDDFDRQVKGHFLPTIGGFAKTAIKATGAVTAAFAGMAIFKGGQRAIAIDTANRQLEGLGYNAQQVAKITDNALKAVLGTPYSLAEALTVSTTAIAAGIKPGRQLSKYLALVADTATIAGGSLSEIGAILNKATANVKVHADVLNQLADRGLPVFSWLQKEYKVSGEALTKMVKKGQVDAKTLLKVIRDHIGGAAQKAGQSIRGSFSNLITAIARLGDALVGPIFGSVAKFLQSIRNSVDDLTTHIKPLGEALGRIFKQFQRAPTLSVKFRVLVNGLEGGWDSLHDILFGRIERRTLDALGRPVTFEVKTEGLVGKFQHVFDGINWDKVAKAIADGLARLLYITSEAANKIISTLAQAITDNAGTIAKSFVTVLKALVTSKGFWELAGLYLAFSFSRGLKRLAFAWIGREIAAGLAKSAIGRILLAGSGRGLPGGVVATGAGKGKAGKAGKFPGVPIAAALPAGVGLLAIGEGLFYYELFKQQGKPPPGAIRFGVPEGIHRGTKLVVDNKEALKHIDQVTNALNGVPHSRAVQLRENALSVREHIDLVKRSIDAIKPEKTIKLNIVGNALSYASALQEHLDLIQSKKYNLQTGGSAAGTPFWRGGLTWVGEKGPELLNLPRGSKISSHEKSLSALSGRSIAGTITITNWREGTGYFEEIASDNVQGAASLAIQRARMSR